MKNEELRKKAFDFASETTKQLITLSTALLALSITFWDKFQDGGSKTVLVFCWVTLFTSVLFGIGTLMALTGTLEKSTEDGDEKAELSIYGSNVKRPSGLQILFFLIGLLLLAVYGGQSLFSDRKPTTNDEIKVIRESTYKLVEPIKKDTLKIE
jgi:hypothetical protein